MDYIEYLALLGHAEYLDAQGKFAEADKTIRVAQFGGFGNQGGFGNLGGMFGGRGGANPGALGTGALVNQAFTGRNPLQNILGTAAAAAAYEQQRKQQSNSGKDALVQAQDKLRQLEEQLSKEVADSPRKGQLEAEVAKQKIVIQNLQKLPYYQAPAAAPPAGQQQVGQQSQGAFPATAQLDTRKVFNLVAQATDGPTLSKIIEQNRFTPAEENLAYQIFMNRQQQSAAQAPGQQAGVAQTGQLTPEVQAAIVTLAMNPTLNRNTAWAAITADDKIPPAAKVLALEYYDNKKQDPKYIAQVANQAQSQTAQIRQDVVDEALIQVNKAPAGRKIEFLNLYASAKGLSQAEKKAVYDKFMLANFNSSRPARPASKPAKPAARPAPAKPAGR